MLYKIINIGQSIKDLVKQKEMPTQRICNFFNKDEAFVNKVYESTSIDTDLLLRWSKLLEYDFFRLYTSHLILYSPPSAVGKGKKGKSKNHGFRKNIYTQEIKDFIIKKVKKKEMTQAEITREYSIPKTTLHKWLQKAQEK